MLLLTTTPASAITPIPVMTIPKGCPMISSPRKTPMVDITTADSTRPTERKLLNCASSTTKIRKIAAAERLAQELTRGFLLFIFARKLPADACKASRSAFSSSATMP
jgi:hypothetical protein